MDTSKVTADADASGAKKLSPPNETGLEPTDVDPSPGCES